VTARAFAAIIGFVMLIPAATWALAVRVTTPQSSQPINR
jgi:hypothetical protein